MYLCLDPQNLPKGLSLQTDTEVSHCGSQKQQRWLKKTVILPSSYGGERRPVSRSISPAAAVCCPSAVSSPPTLRNGIHYF